MPLHGDLLRKEVYKSAKKKKLFISFCACRSLLARHFAHCVTVGGFSKASKIVSTLFFASRIFVLQVKRYRKHISREGKKSESINILVSCFHFISPCAAVTDTKKLLWILQHFFLIDCKMFEGNDERITTTRLGKRQKGRMFRGLLKACSVLSVNTSNVCTRNHIKM